MTKAIRNDAASVRAKLQNLSRERREDFQLVLIRYVSERFLYRLSQSQYKDNFVLKGAMLFILWSEATYRPTRDLDFAGFGSERFLQTAIGEICAILVDDGIKFLPESLSVEPIRDAAEYHGIRVRIDTRLEQASIPMQIDIGFGDVIDPKPEIVNYPTLLNTEAPRIRAYPREAVLAEKFHAMVILGEANSRMKDFYDVYVLTQKYSFSAEAIRSALATTFRNRKTDLPQTTASIFDKRFYEEPARFKFWQRFLDRVEASEVRPSFVEVGTRIKAFFEPMVSSVNPQQVPKTWGPAGPWKL